MNSARGAVRDGTYSLSADDHTQPFQTGAVRDNGAGKGRPDLISPIFLQRLAVLLEKGAEKYGAHNWERGVPISSFASSALRHINQYLEGRREEDHLVQAAFNLMGAVHTIEMIDRGLLPAALYDLKDYTPAPAGGSSGAADNAPPPGGTGAGRSDAPLWGGDDYV